MLRKIMIAFAAICFALPAQAAETKPTVIKYSVTFPATGPQSDGARVLMDLVKKYSNGNLIIEFYPSSQLGDKIASMEGLIAGTIEMTETAATDLSSYSSLWSVLSLPYLWDNASQAINTLTDPEVRTVLEKAAEEIGFVIIAWSDLGSRSILNTQRPVNTPADLRGLRIRVMEDPILAETITAMGAAATPLAWSEVYTSLQQGTIQGLENSPPILLTNGLEEVAKYYSLTEQFVIPDPHYVSKRFFDSLSPENKVALLKAGNEFTEIWNKDIWVKVIENSLKTMEDRGVKINQVDKDAFANAVQPVIDKFLANADADQKALYDLLIKVRARH